MKNIAALSFSLFAVVAIMVLAANSSSTAAGSTNATTDSLRLLAQ